MLVASLTNFLPTISKALFIATHKAQDYIFKSLPKIKIRSTKLKAFADDKINLDQLMILSLKRVAILWENEKMLVTSIYSFSHSVYKSFLFKWCSKWDCKGLN